MRIINRLTVFCGIVLFLLLLLGTPTMQHNLHMHPFTVPDGIIGWLTIVVNDLIIMILTIMAIPGGIVMWLDSQEDPRK